MKSFLGIIFIFMSLALLTSCGKDGGGGSGTGISSSLKEQAPEGLYRAILRPLNNHLSGFLPTGFADVKIEGDEIQIKTLLDDDATVPHMQSIHVGTRCPTILDDKNGDGIVDIQESHAASGDILISLDSDISSSSAGEGIWPMGGGFTYTRSTSLSALENEVRIRTGQNLHLSGRVVLLHGVAADTELPMTVAVEGDMTPQASVPIACGSIKKYE